MRERLSSAVFALLVLVAAALVAFLSTRYAFEADWSAGARASLGEASTKLLASLDGPVEVTSYASRQNGLRAVIADFVDRYRRVKPDLTLRFVDPDADPNAMRAAGISVDGELDIRYKGRDEHLKVLGEQAFSSALLRLSRSRERIVAFLEGDGERQPLGKANQDLGRFAEALAARGVRSVPLPLATLGKIPENTDLLVVADPAVELAPAVVDELIDWLGRGGALLWLTEPGERAGLDRLADALSIRVLPGTVVDGSGSALGLGDPSFVALSSYPGQAITSGFKLTTLLPQPAALAALSGSTKWNVKPFLRSSDKSWNETGHIPKAGEGAGTIRQDADAGEIPGPLDLAFALTRLSPRPDRDEQRAAVVGDADFLSNSFLGNGGNRELGERLVDWLLGDDAQVQVPDRTAPDRALALSQAGLDALAAAFLVALPLLLLATGLAIGYRRRRR